jgi:pyridoxine 5'-phosphate synthase PdxJ
MHAGTGRHDCWTQKQATPTELIVRLPQASQTALAVSVQVCTGHGMPTLDTYADGFGGYRALELRLHVAVWTS